MPGRLFLVFLGALLATSTIRADEESLRKAVTFYASFDDRLEADVGAAKTLSTRSGPPGKGPYTFTPGFDKKVFRIAAGKGIAGGALEVTDILPNNGRVFFPVKDNLAYKKGGWAGAVSFWLNTDPNTRLKTPFCDPFQITQRGANNGGIWCDFDSAKPRRALRMGVYPAAVDGQKPIDENDPTAPVARLPAVDFKAGDWHHVVVTWKNLDALNSDALATFYVDGRRRGVVKGQIAMNWDIEKTGIYVAVNYVGLLDEFAVFGRELEQEDVDLLRTKPGVLKRSRP